MTTYKKAQECAHTLAYADNKMNPTSIFDVYNNIDTLTLPSFNCTLERDAKPHNRPDHKKKETKIEKNTNNNNNKTNKT